VKFLLSPMGLILIAAILLVLFWPRRTPDKLKKFGKPMRAFDDEPEDGHSDGSSKEGDAPLSDAQPGGADRSSNRDGSGSRS
jgi:Sec-independent protein translocase protein TatA